MSPHHFDQNGNNNQAVFFAAGSQQQQQQSSCAMAVGGIPPDSPAPGSSGSILERALAAKQEPPSPHSNTNMVEGATPHTQQQAAHDWPPHVSHLADVNVDEFKADGGPPTQQHPVSKLPVSHKRPFPSSLATEV